MSKHVVQRIAERAGVETTWRDVLEMLPNHKLDRIGRGEEFRIGVEDLGLDLICRECAIVTAVPVMAPTRAWRRRAKARGSNRAVLDDVVELVVGGRVRRVEA